MAVRVSLGCALFVVIFLVSLGSATPLNVDDIWDAFHILNKTLSYQRNVTEHLTAKVHQLEQENERLEGRVTYLEARYQETNSMQGPSFKAANIHRNLPKRSVTSLNTMLLDMITAANSFSSESRHLIDNLTTTVQMLQREVSGIQNGTQHFLVNTSNSSNVTMHVFMLENTTSLKFKQLENRLESSIDQINRTLHTANGDLMQKVNELKKQQTDVVELRNNLTSLEGQQALEIQDLIKNISHNAVCWKELEFLTKNVTKQITSLEAKCQSIENDEHNLENRLSSKVLDISRNLSDTWRDLKQKDDDALRNFNSTLLQLESKIVNLSQNASCDENKNKLNELMVRNISKSLTEVQSQLTGTENTLRDSFSSLNQTVKLLEDNITQQGRELAYHTDIMNTFKLNISNIDVFTRNISRSMDDIYLSCRGIENNTKIVVSKLDQRLTTVVNNLTIQGQELMQEEKHLSNLDLNVSYNTLWRYNFSNSVADLHADLIIRDNKTRDSLGKLDELLHVLIHNVTHQGSIVYGIAENVSRRTEDNFHHIRNITGRLDYLNNEYQRIQIAEESFEKNVSTELFDMSKNVADIWVDLSQQRDIVQNLTSNIQTLEQNVLRYTVDLVKQSGAIDVLAMNVSALTLNLSSEFSNIPLSLLDAKVNATQDAIKEIGEKVDSFSKNITHQHLELSGNGNKIEALSQKLSQDEVSIKQSSLSSQSLIIGFNGLQAQVQGINQKLIEASVNLTRYQQQLTKQSKDLNALSKNVSRDAILWKQNQNIINHVAQLGRDVQDLKLKSEENQKNTTLQYETVSTMLSQTLDDLHQQDLMKTVLLANVSSLGDNLTQLQQQTQIQNIDIEKVISLLKQNLSRNEEVGNQTYTIIRLLTKNLGELEARLTKNENSSKFVSEKMDQTLQKLTKNVTELEKKDIANTGSTGQSTPVAFSARLTHNTAISNMETILYNDVQTNIGGGYDPTTGQFTAPVGGVYVFTVSLMTRGPDSMHARIVKNGAEVGRVFSNRDDYDTASLTVLSNLQVGDIVYVQHFFENLPEDIFGDEPVNTFSGILIK